ncbi:MAG TPA: FliG C-terminal domain-containing protein [bacterium]|nr:FliG C-terminal domain-containing protein [bacterium]
MAQREVFRDDDTLVVRSGGLELCLTRGGRHTWVGERFTIFAELTDNEFATVADEAVSEKRGALGAILARAFAKLDALDQQRALAELRQSLPELAEQLRRDLVMFEDLGRLDDRVLQKFIVLSLGEEWARALQGADQSLVNIILNNMSERARGVLREELQFYRQTDTADIMRSREAIVNRLRQLRAGR